MRIAAEQKRAAGAGRLPALRLLALRPALRSLRPSLLAQLVTAMRGVQARAPEPALLRR